MKQPNHNQEKSGSHAAGQKNDAPEASTAPDAADLTTEVLPESPQAAISQAELDALMAKAKQADENWDRFLRIAADLENYKKRAVREKDEAVRLTRERVVNKVLPVVDALEKGLASLQNEAANDSFAEGMKIVHSMLKGVLNDCGVEEIAAVGEKFNPVMHHALAEELSERHPQDVITQQIRRGYRMGDKVLRAADVIVSSGIKPNS